LLHREAAVKAHFNTLLWKIDRRFPREGGKRLCSRGMGGERKQLGVKPAPPWTMTTTLILLLSFARHRV